MAYPPTEYLEVPPERDCPFVPKEFHDRIPDEEIKSDSVALSSGRRRMPDTVIRRLFVYDEGVHTFI